MDDTQCHKNVIAVDAMGGDAGPEEVVKAVSIALEKLPALDQVILLGDEKVLRPKIFSYSLDKNPRIKVHHTTQIIGMDEKPIPSLKSKKDSSMVRGIELVKAGEAQLLLSTGNTGSLMAGGTIKLRPMEGIDRPALGTVWPTPDSHFILLDAGANPEAEAKHLVHNAILGSHYAKHALGIATPRIGLLTIGTEEGKGTEQVNAANKHLNNMSHLINYSGLIEGFQVFTGEVDVVVCDGFTGNILLKTCESLFGVLKGYLKEELTRNLRCKLGALLAKPAFMRMKEQLSPEEYGGAPLLGLKGHIMKSHGSSNYQALVNALRIGLEVIQHELNKHIQADILEANRIMQESEV